MATWYRVWYSGLKIDPVEVVRETKDYVFVQSADPLYGAQPRRDKKFSGYESIHPSFRAAKLELIAHLSKKLQNARDIVSRLEYQVSAANEYPEPVEETKA